MVSSIIHIFTHSKTHLYKKCNQHKHKEGFCYSQKAKTFNLQNISSTVQFQFKTLSAKRHITHIHTHMLILYRYTSGYIISSEVILDYTSFVKKNIWINKNQIYDILFDFTLVQHKYCWQNITRKALKALNIMLLTVQ